VHVGSPRDGFRERGALGHLRFGAPSRCDLFGRLSEKRERIPLSCVAPPQKSIFCCVNFGSPFALDVQQKLQPLLHFYQEQTALRSFLGIYSSFVYNSEVLFVKFPWFLAFFCRFVLRMYTFLCGAVLPPSRISSSCRPDYLYVNYFFIVTVTTYFIEQTNTIHSVDTELIYAVLKLSFSKQYKI